MRRISAFAAVVLLVYAAPVKAADAIRDDVRGKLRQAAASREKVIIRGLNLGGASLQEVEVEPFQVWAADGILAVHKIDGSVDRQRPPKIDTFRGRVLGASEESMVYFSLQPNGKVSGLALVGERRYDIETASRIPGGTRNRSTDEPNMFTGPVAVRGHDFIDDLKEGQHDTAWTCHVEKLPASGNLSIPIPEEIKAKLRQQANAGNVAGATYSLRLTVETDNELRAAFAVGAPGMTALSAYITDLVGKSSVIYQRDLATTLTLGHANVYDTGVPDPWMGGSTNAATNSLLGELGTYYSTAPGLGSINYGGTTRSSVVWVSGRATSSGVAWSATVCDPNFSCGVDGSSCGSPDFAGKYAGGYAFCGSTVVTTTVPDPDLTVNGVLYGLPANNNFWMLTEFVHELGHNIGADHTHCVALDAAEKILYGVTRNFVDECANFEGGCFGGTEATPSELGSIMSYCHNRPAAPGDFRPSRYTFGRAGETSAKMLTLIRADLETATPNPTITTAAPPLACSAGRTASVTACAGCTFSWQITGGVITSSTTISSITFTPSAASVTLIVTVLKNNACGITASRTIATSCGAVIAPANVVATAMSPTAVSVTWTAAPGAVSYQVFRSSGGAFTQVVPGTTATTTYNDTTAVANTAYEYRVRSVDGAAAVSGDSNEDIATTVVFTDPALSSAITIKLVHMTELRAAVNAMDVLAGLLPAAFTDPTLTTTTLVKAVHVTELRTNLNDARTFLGYAAITPTDAVLSSAINIKAAHLAELRAGTQ